MRRNLCHYWGKLRMIKRIRKSLGYFFIKRKFPLEYSDVVSFKGFYKNTRNILVALPIAINDPITLHVFLAELIKDNKKVYLLLKENLLESIPNKNNYSYILINDDEISRLRIPVNGFKEKLSRENIDLFIDLEFDESLLNYAVASISKAKYRVGFAKKGSDKFYNFQIPAGERNCEISYRNLLNSLRMF